MNKDKKICNKIKNSCYFELFTIFRLFIYQITLFIILNKICLRFIIYKIVFSPISSQPEIYCSNKDFQSIQTKDFKIIISHFNPSGKEHKNIQLFFHGNAQSIYNANQLFKTRCLEADVKIAFIEFPGENGLITPFTKENVITSAKKAIKYLMDENYRITHCIGFSIGTGIAAEVACKHEIPYLVLIAPYYNLVELINFHFKLQSGNFKNFKNSLDEVMNKYFNFNTQNTLRGYKGNLTLYHGKDDTIIPYGHSKTLQNTHYGFDRPKIFYRNRRDDHNSI